MKHKPQLIVALDVESFGKAKRWVDLLYPKVKIFKVGLELFLASGRNIIRYIKRKGAKVFLDLKFYDIPNTVAKASGQMVRLGVDMFTLHAQGGAEMLYAAKQAVKQEAKHRKRQPPLLLGVTVLTSKDNKVDLKQHVLSLAREVKAARLDGIVCSVWEAKAAREKLGNNFMIATPGIRLDKQTKDDQRRTATPKQAQQAGSNFLVIGRPILEAKDPLSVVQKILNELNLVDK